MGSTDPAAKSLQVKGKKETAAKTMVRALHCHQFRSPTKRKKKKVMMAAAGWSGCWS